MVLCYGILFEEGFKFPWDDYHDLETWWEHVRGFTDTNPWNEWSALVEGVSSQDISDYFQARKEWYVKHPLPVELVNYGSTADPMYIIAVMSFTTPKRFEKLPANPDAAGLLSFLAEFRIPGANPAWWYISSYRRPE
jgi:hypothetical protein